MVAADSELVNEQSGKQVPSEFAESGFRAEGVREADVGSYERRKSYQFAVQEKQERRIEPELLLCERAILQEVGHVWVRRSSTTRKLTDISRVGKEADEPRASS